MNYLFQFEAPGMLTTQHDSLRAKIGFWTPGISPRFV
jgi:hypothetical protein